MRKVRFKLEDWGTEYAFTPPPTEELRPHLRRGYWWRVVDWGGCAGEPAQFTRARDLLAWVAQELGGFRFEDGPPYSWEAKLVASRTPEGEREAEWEIRPRAVVRWVPVRARSERFAFGGSVPWAPGVPVRVGFAYTDPRHPGRVYREIVAEDLEGEGRFQTPDGDGVPIEAAVGATLRAMDEFAQLNEGPPRLYALQDLVVVIGPGVGERSPLEYPLRVRQHVATRE